MKFAIRISQFVICLAFACQVAAAQEVRALWVVRTTLTSPDKIRQLVSSAADNGFNTLIVQIRGRGDAYYNSRVEPRAIDLKDQPPAFDPLALTIAEAHKRGLKVHGWINTNLLANLDALPVQPDHVYNKHPEWLAVPRPVAAELYNVSPRDPAYRQKIVEWSRANRAELEGVYTGPANPKVRDHIYNIWMDVLKNYRVDGLHFDYVRFASPDFDYSRTSLGNFRKWLEPQLTADQRRELKKSLQANPLAAPEMFPEKFADFQRAQVTMLVERIYRAVKKRRPDALVSAAVFANDENAYTRRFQDWRRWFAAESGNGAHLVREGSRAWVGRGGRFPAPPQRALAGTMPPKATGGRRCCARRPSFG